MKKILFLIVLLWLFPVLAWATADTLRPEADVWIAEGEWPQNTGDTRWEAIDEISSDGDDTYVSETNQDDWYIWRSSDWTGSGSIDSIGLFAVTEKDKSFLTQMWIGRAYQDGEAYPWLAGTETGDTLLITLTESYVEYSIHWDHDPITGSAWTAAGLNNDDHGWGFYFEKSLGGTIAKVTQSYIIVYSTTAAPSGNPVSKKKKMLGGLYDEEDFRLLRLACLAWIW